jgi:hypothetical protein
MWTLFKDMNRQSSPWVFLGSGGIQSRTGSIGSPPKCLLVFAGRILDFSFPMGI